MGKIWEFFDTLDELVYVSDINTYELVYMNRKVLQTYGFRSLEEIAGQKCYEVLQNCSTPCSMCNNEKLKQGQFREWQYYNPILERQVMIKDTLVEADGRQYRMELAFDASRQEQRDNIMNLEAKINEGLRVALHQKTPSQTLEVLLEYLGKALGGERTYIFERNEQGCDDNTYEWVASGVTSEKDSLQNLPSEICANWYQNFRIGKHIVIKKLEDIRESDPLQYENLKRRNLIRKLEEISYLDQLTQIGNRHAMNRFLCNLREKDSLGIVYCDITGLKRVNDRDGHSAGDKLIVDACACLKRSFGEYSLFRIGGDELLALCTGIDESSLWQRIEQLKKYLQANSIFMAIGGLWERDTFGGIDRLIAEAENRMYSDKAAYYMKFGMDRRHPLDTISGWI